MLQSRQARPAMKVRNAFLRILLCQIEHLLTLSYMAYFKVYHNFAASLKWSCVGIILEFDSRLILYWFTISMMTLVYLPYYLSFNHLELK